jgi:hypothetical protein
MAPLFTGNKFGFSGLSVPIYSISPSTLSLNEGSSVTFTISTINVTEGTTLYWSTNQISGTINASDFSDSSTSGSFVITNGLGTIVRSLSNDLSTEGTESFQIQIRTESTSGPIVVSSPTISITDTSVTLPSYTGYELNNADGVRGAANGTSINASNSGSRSNTGGTATFTTGVPFTTLRVIYGNMANGALGNPSSGAQLYINGGAVGATGTYGSDGYSGSYHKYYDTSNGTLNSIGISAGASGSHESVINAIIINGSKLNATGPTWS